MGIVSSIVAIVITLVGVATTIAREVQKKKADAARKTAERLGKPIKPPYFYQTIAARDAAPNVPASYTTAGIKDALRGGVLPVGYSEEQLTDIGFAPEVETFQAKFLENAIASRKSAGALMEQLLKSIDTQSSADLAAAGVTPEFVAEVRRVAKQASNASATNLIDAQVLQDTIGEIDTLTAAIKGEQTLRDKTTALTDQRLEATASRNMAVLDLARRAFLPNFKPPTIPPTAPVPSTQA